MNEKEYIDNLKKHHRFGYPETQHEPAPVVPLVPAVVPANVDHLDIIATEIVDSVLASVDRAVDVDRRKLFDEIVKRLKRL
jgi:hypothetical protein